MSPSCIRSFVSDASGNSGARTELPSFPAQTAALLEPYLDGEGGSTDHAGELFVSPEAFGRLATKLDASGWQIHTHSIGDATVRASLGGFEAAQTTNGEQDHRQRPPCAP